MKKLVKWFVHINKYGKACNRVVGSKDLCDPNLIYEELTTYAGAIAAISNCSIYVIRSSGDDGDTITWVGTDEEEAFKVINAQHAEKNYISIWENGKEISEYYRYAWYDNPEQKIAFNPDQIRFDKWERNSGAIIPRLENQNGNTGTTRS